MGPFTNKLGVAVVGLGVGEQHARSYVADERCRLRWLFDIDPKRAGEVAAALGAGSVAGSYEQILNDRDTHVVSVASYDDAHYEQVVRALGHGKHVFVEKPLCRSIDELRAIEEAWSDGGKKVKISSNLILRAAPLYRWFKRELELGAIGELYAFDGDYLYGRLEKITDGWRKNVDDYSVMQGGGIHLVDLMLWLSGQRPESVFSVGNNICSVGTAFRYNDHVSSTFRFPSGLVGRVTANFGCIHRHQHVVRAFGTKATFLYDDAGPRLHTTREELESSKALDYSPLPAGKGDLIPAFVSTIIEGRDGSAQTQQMFDVISVCAAADKSLRTGVEVEIQYI